MTTLRRSHPEEPDATPDPLEDLAAPTTDRLPEHRRGGQELPDEVQDRPEQNAGYDEAVRGGRDPDEEADGVSELDGDSPDAFDEGSPSIDDRAEADVIAEVRRRERKRR
jgi:hypothetical protein